MPKLSEIIEVLEKAAPPGLAADWDNSGLQVGDPGAEIRRVLVALDPVPAVISEAERLGAQLVVSHHPLFFKAVKRLDLSRGQGALVRRAVEGGVAVYSAHTPLDRVQHGVSDALADVMGLKKTVPLEAGLDLPAGCGFGRVGRLPKARKAGELAGLLKVALGLDVVRLTGDPEAAVKTVAVCGGSGSELIPAAAAAGAGLYVTGDVKYHDAFHALELGLCVLDVGHFASEFPAVPQTAKALLRAFAKKGWKVQVSVSEAQEEPWVFL